MMEIRNELRYLLSAGLWERMAADLSLIHILCQLLSLLVIFKV